jgi:hypothetical protein
MPKRRKVPGRPLPCPVARLMFGMLFRPIRWAPVYDSDSLAIAWMFASLMSSA